MYLRTNIPIKVNKKIQGNEEVYVILRHTTLQYNELFNLSAQYKYLKEVEVDGNIIEEELEGFPSKEISFQEVDAIYEQIKGYLPEGLTKSQSHQLEFYLGAKYLMYQFFIEDNPTLTLENIIIVP